MGKPDLSGLWLTNEDPQKSLRGITWAAARKRARVEVISEMRRTGKVTGRPPVLGATPPFMGVRAHALAPGVMLFEDTGADRSLMGE